MAEIIQAFQTYRHTIFINDTAPPTAPTQCAVLRRYWRCNFATAGTAHDTLAVAVRFDNLFAPLYKLLLNNNAQYRGSTFERVSGALPFPIAARTIANAGIGTAGAIAMAKQTAGLIGLYTAFIGKKNRGRQFVPFPSTTSDAGNGLPTAAYGIDLANLALQLRTNISLTVGADTVQFDPVIWNKLTPGSNLIVVTGTPRTTWATQRRRGDFGRANQSPI